VLGDRVERHPLAPRTIAGGVASRSAAAEDREDVLDRAFPVGPRSRASVLVDDPEVAQHAVLERRLANRLERESVGECLEPLLIVDCHAQHLACLGELGLEVAGVAEPEGPLCRRSVLSLAQRRSQGAGAHNADWRGRRGDRHGAVVAIGHIDVGRGQVAAETPAARRADIHPQQGTAGLGDALRVWRAGAQQWVFEFERDLSSRYQARGELTADGSLNYWHSPIFWGDEGGRQVIMERSVTRAVYQPLAAASWLYERAGFHGGIDVAVAVLGIENAVGGTLFREFHPPTYGASDYRAHARVTSEELRSDLGGLVRRLLDPLFDVISVRGYDPLADNR
jgi:hypothetical protein